MTDKLDIEEIKRDRETGTPGDWYLGCCLTRVCGPLERGKRGAAAVIAKISGGSWASIAEHVANARRIARVPAMETRILSDADRIADLEAQLREAREANLGLIASFEHFGAHNSKLYDALAVACRALEGAGLRDAINRVQSIADDASEQHSAACREARSHHDTMLMHWHRAHKEDQSHE